MRIALPLILLTSFACAPKTPPDAAAGEATADESTAAQPEATAASTEEAEPSAEGSAPESAESIGVPTETGNEPVALIPDEEAPPPELAPRKSDNADFNVTITFGDGTTRTEHVRRTEVSKDWYGEKEWADTAGRLVITVEANGQESELTWTDLSSLTITPKSVSKDANCTYDSDYTPWMYTCELGTTSTAKDKAGKRYSVVDRHKWRFVFDDDTELEFWIYKLPARMQDEGGVEYGMDHGENYAIYGDLQQQLRNDVRTMVKSIRIK